MSPAAPLATYRVQFSPDFVFDQALVLPAYLADLGVGALYASPIWEARAGSRHGYGVTDPGAIRAELGGEEGFNRLADEVRQRGLGLVLDIVPNHVAASTTNPWWRDVLEHGPASPYARYFDIDWDSGPGGRLVLPVLNQDPPGILLSMLLEHTVGARWFGGKSKVILSAEIVDTVPLPVGDSIAHLVLLRVGYSEGEPDIYDVPIALAVGADAERMVNEHPASLICRVRLERGNGSAEGVVYDPVHDPAFGRALLATIARRRARLE